MPELPEVENLRRSLLGPLVGRTVRRVQVSRLDVVRPQPGLGRVFTPASRLTPKLATGLLRDDVIVELIRHGKQLAIVGRSGRVLCIHLGMSGQVRYLQRAQPMNPSTHVHVIWSLGDDRAHPSGRLAFRDPRRFGGIWLAPSLEHLRSERWGLLGPDGLTLTRGQLWQAMHRSTMPIKAALLNQKLIAGVGNIYADESLHLARIHPRRRADQLGQDEIARLHRAIRVTLREAVEQGGSTLRDYVDASGDPGAYAAQHRVYGRSGKPCTSCGQPLRRATIAQRTTAFCPHCQAVC